MSLNFYVSLGFFTNFFISFLLTIIQVHNLTTQLRTLQSKVKNVKEDNALKQRKLAKVEIELGPLKQKVL